MVTKTSNGNGVGWRIATLLMALLVFVGGALWAANTAKVDSIKADHERLITRNEDTIKDNTKRLTDVEKSQIRQEAKLENMDEKIDILLRANGVPESMIPKTKPDTVRDTTR